MIDGIHHTDKSVCILPTRIISWDFSTNVWNDSDEEEEDVEDDQGERSFKKTYKGVEVRILEKNGEYFFESTNYGSNEERANAIDHFHKKYNFQNWK